MSLENINEVDREALEVMRYHGPQSITELCERFAVTATAIRQRLSRLEANGLVERFLHRGERGRPGYHYRLTQSGLEAVGDNLADLAEDLWLEVLAIPDATTRQAVLDGVLQRLTDRYRSEVSGTTVTERLKSIASIFRKRQIPFVVESGEQRSDLRIVGCPYPRLDAQGREICELEQKLVERLLDAPVALEHCRCESTGGKCCMFTAESLQALNVGAGDAVAGNATASGNDRDSSQR